MEEDKNNLEAELNDFEANNIFDTIFKNINKAITNLAPWLALLSVIVGSVLGYMSFSGYLKDFENSINNVERDVEEIRTNVARLNESAAATNSRIGLTPAFNTIPFEGAIAGAQPIFAGNLIVYLSGCGQRNNIVTCYVSIANIGSSQGVFIYLNKDNARTSTATLSDGSTVNAIRIVDQNGRSVVEREIEPGSLPNWHLAQVMDAQEVLGFSVHYPVSSGLVRRLASIRLRIQEQGGAWDDPVVFEDIPVVVLE